MSWGKEWAFWVEQDEGVADSGVLGGVYTVPLQGWCRRFT